MSCADWSLRHLSCADGEFSKDNLLHPYHLKWRTCNCGNLSIYCSPQQFLWQWTIKKCCMRASWSWVYFHSLFHDRAKSWAPREEWIWCCYLMCISRCFFSFWFPKHYVFFSGEYSTWRLDKDLNIHFMVYLCMCIGVMSSFRRQCFIIFACFIVVLILYWTRNGRHISYTTSDEQVWVSCVPV